MMKDYCFNNIHNWYSEIENATYDFISLTGVTPNVVGFEPSTHKRICFLMNQETDNILSSDNKQIADSYVEVGTIIFSNCKLDIWTSQELDSNTFTIIHYSPDDDDGEPIPVLNNNIRSPIWKKIA